MSGFYLFTYTSEAKLSALVQPRLQFDETLKSVLHLVLHLKHRAHIMTSPGSVKLPQFASSFYQTHVCR